jgi:hypothetical protein
MKPAQLFILSAGALLVAVATVLVVSNMVGRDMSPPPDPVLHVGIDTLFWLVASVAGGIGAYCLLGKKSGLQLGLVAWVSGNFAVYVGGLLWLREAALFTVLQLGGVADAFNITAKTAGIGVLGCFGYLLVGNLVMICVSRPRKTETSAKSIEPASESLKMSCQHCEGHIAFPVSRLGEKLTCPHCANSIQPERTSGPAAI